MASLADLQKATAVARDVRDAAVAALNDIDARLRQVRETQAKEQAGLRALEQEAIDARSEGRPFKASKLDDLRSDVRLTSDTLAALLKRRQAAQGKADEAQHEFNRASAAESNVLNGVLMMEFGAIIAAVLDHAKALGGAEFEKRVRRVVGGQAEGDAVSEGLSLIADYGMRQADLVRVVGSILRTQIQAPQLLVDALPVAADTQLAEQILGLIAEEGERLEEVAARAKAEHDAEQAALDETRCKRGRLVPYSGTLQGVARRRGP